MATLITDENKIITDFPTVAVEYKNSLDDVAWLPVYNLYCNKLTRNVNAYDEAELVYNFGELRQPGTSSFLSYAPLNILGKFIRVTIPQVAPLLTLRWVGFVVGSAKQRSAAEGANPAARKLTGTEQSIRAVGLEYFLDRVQIDSSIVFPDTRIYRAIPFNGGKGLGYDVDAKTRGNRSADDNLDNSYTFLPSNESGQLWTCGQIVNYLLQYFQPRDKDSENSPTRYVFDADDLLDGVLNGIAPTLNPDGMTVFEAINKLLSPQRGFVWWLEFDELEEDGHQARIRVETLTSSEITLPTAGTVPANRDQQSLDFDRQRDVEDVVIADNGSRIYHQIIVRGARMTSTCTLGNLSYGGEVNEIGTDWTDAIKTEYENAASSTAGYDDLDESEKAKRNDAYRQSERLARVFSYFRLKTNWDGKSGDGGGGPRDWTFPELSSTGSVLGGLPFSVNGIRILNHTRMKRGWDYESMSEIGEITPAGTEVEYMPSFVIFKVSTGDDDNDKYQFADKMNDSDYAEGEPVSDKISTSYSLRMQQTTPGFILHATGAQHACALNHWGEEAAATDTDPQVDYATLRLTATLEADSYCEGRYPEDAALPENAPLQKLLLYVGDEYRLDFLPENTVVDLENGEPILTDGGVLRDDRKHCADIARAAYEWYRLDRHAITVSFRQVRNLFRLGMYITTIGEGSVVENVHTVVSSINYDLQRGTMTIQTNDKDLDLVRVV